MNYENEEMEIDLREIFFLLWRKIWILLLAVAAGGIIIGSYSYYFITPTYQSTAKVYIVSGSADSLVSLSDIQIGSSLTKDYLILVKSRPVVEKVIDNLDMDISYRSMAKKIDVSNEDGTRIVNITVTDTNPQVSKKIANETVYEEFYQVNKSNHFYLNHLQVLFCLKILSHLLYHHLHIFLNHLL